MLSKTTKNCDFIAGWKKSVKALFLNICTKWTYPVSPIRSKGSSFSRFWPVGDIFREARFTQPFDPTTVVVRHISTSDRGRVRDLHCHPDPAGHRVPLHRRGRTIGRHLDRLRADHPHDHRRLHTHGHRWVRDVWIFGSPTARTCDSERLSLRKCLSGSHSPLIFFLLVRSD